MVPLPLLSVKLVPPPMVGGEFSGLVRLPAGKHSHRTVAVVPFMWTETESPDGWPPGWKPSTSGPVDVTENGAWVVNVPAARQHAATLVMTGFHNPVAHWSAKERGALPTFPVEYLIAAEKKVVIISVPYKPFTGLVTGFANALEPASDYQIKVVAWTKKDGEERLIGDAVLTASGVWTRQNLTDTQLEADEYWVALTKGSFRPDEQVPRLGDDVLDLQWMTHNPRPPMTRAAGGGS
jgi:hypothetical protein